MADFVRLVFPGKRYKLMFRHQDLRDASMESKRSVGELLGDPFAGWPFLLKYGLRMSEHNMSLNRASDLIEQWITQPDPETQKIRTLEQLADKFSQATERFVAPNVIPADVATAEASADAPAEGSEGNALPEAAD